MHIFCRNFLIRNYIFIDVLQHSFLKIYGLFTMAASIGNCINFWNLFGKELLYYKIQYSLTCCSVLFGSFENYMPFPRCLLQFGNALLFEIRYISFLGNVYNFFWKSFLITIQIVTLFLEALQQSFWNMYFMHFFNRIDSIGKCNILQKKYTLI